MSRLERELDRRFEEMVEEMQAVYPELSEEEIREHLLAMGA